MATSIAGSATVAFKFTGISSRLSGGRKLRLFGHFSPVFGSIQLQRHQSFILQCRLKSSFDSSGVRDRVAIIEQTSVEGTKSVKALVLVVIGASRGIGKAIALALGKAGCKN